MADDEVKAPERILVQLTARGTTFYLNDPRDVHDNGKPVYVYVLATRARETWDAAIAVVKAQSPFSEDDYRAGCLDTEDVIAALEAARDATAKEGA